MTTTKAHRPTTNERAPKHGYTQDGMPVHARTHDFVKKDTAAQRFNAAFGLRITVLVGTMWAAYIFAIVALISLPDNVHSTQNLILWISSSFLQLVLLPVIIVGQNIQAKASDKRAEDTYNDAAAVLHEAIQIEKHLEVQDATIER